MTIPGLSRQDWPHDPGGLDAYYGNPRGHGGPDPTWKAQNLVPCVVPWSGHSVQVHKRVYDSLSRVLTRYWDEIGHDQSVVAKYGLADVQTYAYRTNRNNPNKLSNHSYGIAVDIAPSHQPNGAHWIDGGAMMPRRLIELFKYEGWRWGGDFGGTKDPMHFEAVWDSHHDQPPVPAPTDDAAPVTVPVPHSAPGHEDDLLRLMGKFLLDRAGVSPHIEELRKGLLVARDGIDTVVSLLDGAMGHPTAPAPEPEAVHLYGPIAFDTAGVTTHYLDGLKAAGYRIGIRYLSETPGKPIRPDEARAYVEKGMRLALVFETHGGTRNFHYNDINAATGITHAHVAAQQAHVVGAPDHAVIYFAIDTDADASQVHSLVLPYFESIRHALTPFRVGVYGSGLVCDSVISAGFADVPWLAGAMGWRGSRAYAASGKAAMIQSTPHKVAGIEIDTDRIKSGADIGDFIPFQTQGVPMATTTAQIGSPLASKINWTAMAVAATNVISLVSKGKVNLDPDVIVNLVGTLGPLAIVAFRTWGTTTIMPQSLP